MANDLKIKVQEAEMWKKEVEVLTKDIQKIRIDILDTLGEAYDLQYQDSVFYSSLQDITTKLTTSHNVLTKSFETAIEELSKGLNSIKKKADEIIEAMQKSASHIGNQG